jgi:hypothetical protein
MRGMRDRFGWLRGRRGATAAGGGEVGRRTVLMGAAATAGVVAAGSAPALAAPTTPAAATDAQAPRAVATSVAASDVSVVPVGEIIDIDAQSVLAALDRRTSKMNLIDDMQVAMTLVDDFMGNTATSGTIGQLGWALPPTGTGTAAVGVIVNEPGIITIGTGTTSTGWHNMNLGNSNMLGPASLLCEWRHRISAINTGTDACSVWFGLHNNLAGAEPNTGFYFRSTAADGANWQAVCANAGTRSVVDTGVPVDTAFHRFRFSFDGVGIARFYIDGNPVATITTNFPSANGRFSPVLSVRKTAGTVARGVLVDYFALRFEHAR